MELNEHQLARLEVALQCPFDAKAAGFPIGARGLVYGVWHAILTTKLPDRTFADLLVDWEDTAHRSIWEDVEEGSEPSPVSFALELLDVEEFDRVIPLLEGSRKDLFGVRGDSPAHRARSDVGAIDRADVVLYPPAATKSLIGVWLDEEFNRLTTWFQAMHIVPAEKRNKHWPPPHIRTEAELLAYSRSKPDEGILSVDADEQELLRCCLAATEGAFCRDVGLSRESEAASEIGHSNPESLQPAAYLAVWNRLSSLGSFRLGIEHLRDVGAAGGAMTRKLVYDVSPTGCEFHCYPVRTFPPLKHVFLEGALELWA